MRSPLPLIALVLLAAALLATPAAAAPPPEMDWALPDFLMPTLHVAFDEYTRAVDLNAYDPGQEAIGQIEIIAPPDSITTFSLYDYRNIITGEINRTTTGLNSEEVTYRIGDQVSGPTPRGTTLWGLIHGLPEEIFRIQYAGTNSGERYLRLGIMEMLGTVGPKGLVYVPVENVIYRASFSSSADTRVVIHTLPFSDLSQAINNEATRATSFTDTLKALYDGVVLVISLGWYIFKKIFLENFLLFAGLFEVIGMAYAANKSRDIFQFLKRVMDYNVKAVKAMYWLIEQMITILTRIINALKPL